MVTKKKYRITINDKNKELAIKNIRKGFFHGTNRKIVSSKLLNKARTRKNPSLYNEYEIIYSE